MATSPPATRPEDREYIIFCDESDSSGRYYSNFYGGLIVGSTDIEPVSERLNQVKEDCGFRGEIKWQKVTDQYLEKYITFIDALFDEVEAGRIKIRIMFRHNAHAIHNLPPGEAALTYFRLYYQFVKHAFGLDHIEPQSEGTRVRLYFDEFPETREKVAQFKGFLVALGQSSAFRKARVRIQEEDIAEVRSHQHVLLQGLDIVLGAMCFRLNEKHKDKPPGAERRGRRTIAKEKLYKRIVQRVCRLRSHFNFGASTGWDGDPRNKWCHPYRHWCFQSYQSVYDETKTKASPKKDRPSDPT